MKMASDLRPATSITLESICILLLKATYRDSSGLQMTSEVKAELRIDLSDLNYPGIHVHVASSGRFGGP